MSNWNNIASIYKLSIYISNGEKSTSIYANGNNQIPVDIIIEARDKDNNPVFLSSDEINDHINLVDYKNTPIPSSILTKSKVAGKYVYPVLKQISRDNPGNPCHFYLSVPKVSESPLRVYVQVFINDPNTGTQIEYTTAQINNNNNAIPDYISMRILPARIFTDNDLDILTKQENRVDGYNSILRKYYVRFKSTDNTITHDALCDQRYWFYYRQQGNYKGCSTSTDSSIDISSANYTAKFPVSNSWTISVTSKNHEERGICFWSYRLWYGALWSYNDWSKSLHFFLHDQYGNRADIDVKSNGDQNISFHVLA